MFIPRVKRETVNGKYLLNLPARVYFSGECERRLYKVLCEFMPYLNAKSEPCPENADISVKIDKNLSDIAEYYEIKSNDGKVTLTATDFRGLVNAAATLAQMTAVSEGKIYVLSGEISDYPDKAFRGFMIDTGRKYIPLDEFFAQILLVAKSKMNKIHIHLTDTQGCSFEIEKYDKLPSAHGRKYTREELISIVEYAAIFDIDVIPEVDIPGHAFNIIKPYPEFLCDADEPNGWAMCISNEKTYEYARDMLSFVAEIFPYEYLHVGTDEVDMRDIVTKNGIQMQDWQRCRRCNEFFGKMGLESVTERFYYFVHRIYDIVKSLGKKMMMWNDNIDISKSPDLPRDILIHFWRVAAPMRGPIEGCSMQRFIDEGFEVINSDYPNTYFVKEYIDWERTKVWNIDRVPADAGEKANMILGAFACAWEDRAHLKHSIYSALPAFADRTWNLAPIDDEESFNTALSRFVLGPSIDEGFNVFGDYLIAPFMFDNSLSPISETADRDVAKKLFSSLTHLCACGEFAKKAYLRGFDTEKYQSKSAERVLN